MKQEESPMMMLWRRHPGLSLLAVMLLMLLLLVTWRLWPDSGKDKRDMAVPVTTASVMRTNVPLFLSGLGTVVSPHEVVVRPQIDGQLMALHFREGQVVQRGDLLATLDDRAIRAQQAKARAELNRLQVQAQTAEQDLQRFRELEKEDVTTAQAVEQQAAQLAQTRAAVASAQASLTAAEVNLAYTRITSPAHGRIGLRRVDPGNIVRATDITGLVTVTQTDPMNVIFSLPQEAISTLQAMNKNTPAVVAIFDRAGGQPLATGTLATIDNQIDAANGTIKLKATFANPDNRLWPGQFVNARLQAGEKQSALVIPLTAIQRGRDGNSVYRIRESKAELTPVTIAFENDQLAVISHGLDAGDLVVTEGQLRLRPGARVKLQDGSNHARQ